ncbi:MAG: hypothetical protein JWO22_2026 [Frankiales bacterium]|nr:hypothetical protein [Frankiales bacterium]
MIAAPPVPSPMPLGGGFVQGWACVDKVGASPSPTTTPSPLADLAPSTPMPTTVAVWGKLGQDCAATSWATPYPAANVTVAAGAAASVPPSSYSGNGGWTRDVGGYAGPMVAVVALAVLAVLAVIVWARKGAGLEEGDE